MGVLALIDKTLVDASVLSATSEYSGSFGKENILEASPRACWKSSSDSAANYIVLDFGVGCGYVTGVAFFGCNVRTLSWQMNATDVWTAPSVDESVSFDLFTKSSGVDGVLGNWIQIEGESDYKTHEMRGLYMRMTSGTDSGVTYKILDNSNGRVLIDAASHNIAVNDSFAVFGTKIVKTITGGIYRYARIAIAAQDTAEEYFQVGTIVVGWAQTLGQGWAVGYTMDRIFDIDVMKTPGGELYTLANAVPRSDLVLSWESSGDTDRELRALLEFAGAKHFVLVPDSAVLTDARLVKVISNLSRRHRIGSRFSLSIGLGEVV